MKKLIVFEGPDCAGKTTLINALQGDDDRYLHNGLYDTQNDAIRAYINQFNDFDKYEEDGILFIDRAHWSEHVYGEVIRQRPMLLNDFIHLEDMLNELNAIVVLCLPPYEKALERWRERNDNDQEFVKHISQYIQIYNGYEKILEIAASNVIVYDYTNPFTALTKLYKESR